MPLPRGFGAYSTAPGIRGSAPHSLATASSFTNVGIDFGNTFVYSATWADYDSDGRLDLLALGADYPADYSTPPVAVNKLYHNNGDGTFSENTAAHLPGAAGLFWGWIAWGDYNGDGFADILINGSPGIASTAVTASSTTKLFRNNGDGTFSENTASGLPNSDDAQFIWGDYDGDGRLDIALNGCPESCLENDYVTELYRNDGDGTFSKDANSGLPADFAWLSSGDFNSDGRLDLLVWATWKPENAGIYRNDGTAATIPDSPTRFESRLLPKGVVKLSWRESASKMLDNSLSYNLRVGTTPGGSDVVAPLAGPNGVRQLAAYGNTEGRNSAKLTGLRPGTYYWSVQTVGANYAGSSFALQHEFTIAPTPTLRLLRTKIFACKTGPRATKVFGKVSPGFEAATVALQRRFADGAGWKSVAAQTLSSPGTYMFAKVGKGVERSFWLRVRIRSKLGTVVSRSARVIVTDAGTCAKGKAGAKP
jgi:hypothetical protein